MHLLLCYQFKNKIMTTLKSQSAPIKIEKNCGNPNCTCEVCTCENCTCGAACKCKHCNCNSSLLNIISRSCMSGLLNKKIITNKKIKNEI